MIFQVTPRSSVFPCEKMNLGRSCCQSVGWNWKPSLACFADRRYWVAAGAALGKNLFFFTNPAFRGCICALGCFSGAPQKQLQRRDGAAQGPSHHSEQYTVKCEHERPLVQGAHRKGWKGWGGDFTVTNVLMKKQDWETEQLTGGQRKSWQRGGFHVTWGPDQHHVHEAGGEGSKALPSPFCSLSTARISS